MRIALLLLGFTLFSCGEIKRLDTSRIKSQMDNYKVKQIRPSEMMEKVRNSGQDAEGVLGKAICDKIPAVIDSLETAYAATIELVDLSNFEVERISDEKLNLLFEAYLYDYEQNKALSSNAQRLNNGDYSYTFAYTNNSASCDSLREPHRYLWYLSWKQADLVKTF